MSNTPDWLDDIKLEVQFTERQIDDLKPSTVLHIALTDEAKAIIIAKLEEAELRGRLDELRRACNHNNSEYTSDYLEERIAELNAKNKGAE